MISFKIEDIEEDNFEFEENLEKNYSKEDIFIPFKKITHKPSDDNVKEKFFEKPLSPSRSPKNKVEFYGENTLLISEESKQNSFNNFHSFEKIAISRNPSRKFTNTQKLPLKFSFSSFTIFNKSIVSSIENLCQKNMPVVKFEKKTTLLSRKNKSTNSMIIDENDPPHEKSFTYSIRDTNKSHRNTKEMNQKILKNRLDIEKDPLELDKVKVYKYYYLHNNIEHILAWANSFLTKRKHPSRNLRKNKKSLIKKLCQNKRTYPVKNDLILA